MKKDKCIEITKIVLGVFFLFVLILFVVLAFCLQEFGEVGVVGDYFGGMLNPAFGFLSLLAVLYTINVQLKSVRIQLKELRLTRKELKATTKELAISAEAQAESAKTFKQQQFESTFFSLLNQITMSIDSFHKANIKTDKYNTTTHKAMVQIFNGDSLIYAWRRINENDNSLPKIFILIYQLLKLISKYETELSIKVSEEDAFKTAKVYSNILRACLDRDFLHLFAINGCRTDLNNMNLYKEYIEKYSLLEHIVFHTTHSKSYKDIFKGIVSSYSATAFGNNDAYKELMENKNPQQQTS